MNQKSFRIRPMTQMEHEDILGQVQAIGPGWNLKRSFWRSLLDAFMRIFRKVVGLERKLS